MSFTLENWLLYATISFTLYISPRVSVVLPEWSTWRSAMRSASADDRTFRSSLISSSGDWYSLINVLFECETIHSCKFGQSPHICILFPFGFCRCDIFSDLLISLLYGIGFHRLAKSNFNLHWVVLEYSSSTIISSELIINKNNNLAPILFECYCISCLCLML